MDYEDISRDYKARAAAERAAGGSIEINRYGDYIAITMSDGAEYFFQGEEAQDLRTEFEQFPELSVPLEDYLLAQAQNY
jgi:hypothetical protein